MRALKLTPMLVGLMCALPISVWWFAQLTLVSPLPGPALAPLSLEVLTVLISVQLLVLCLFAPLWVLNDARLCHGRSGALLAAATIASTASRPARPVSIRASSALRNTRAA